MALWPAWGDFETGEGKPSSAFSKGDLLCYTSASSLSRVADAIIAAPRLAGIANADSTQSVNNLVMYTKITPNVVFWSDATAGSTYTRGADVNFNFATANRRYVANTSAGTVLAICERDIADIEGQSVQSRILVRFQSRLSILHS